MRQQGQDKTGQDNFGQVQMFGNFMRFFSGFMGQPRNQPMIEDSPDRGYDITLRIYVPSLDLRLLFPCFSKDRVSKL